MKKFDIMERVEIICDETNNTKEDEENNVLNVDMIIHPVQTIDKIPLTIDLRGYGETMKLEDIGFYTLSDARADTSDRHTPLMRCELVLLDACNFKCPYCRGLREDLKKTVKFEDAMNVLRMWVADGLVNVRFSGGEPTLYKHLDELVMYCRDNGVKRIAISTNGSADLAYYKHLAKCGVNDFSISLDSGCCAVGDKMSGGVENSWEKVVENIKAISEWTYVTVGMVFTEENMDESAQAIQYASSLGVDDIRIISSAQYNQAVSNLDEIPNEIVGRHPILSYRIDNHFNGKSIRGLQPSDTTKCPLVVDDIAVAGKYHFPCIIHLREGGDQIGEVGEDMRDERLDWYHNHDTHKDPICKANCLDVCRDFNNRAER